MKLKKASKILKNLNANENLKAKIKGQKSQKHSNHAQQIWSRSARKTKPYNQAIKRMENSGVLPENQNQIAVGHASSRRHRLESRPLGRRNKLMKTLLSTFALILLFAPYVIGADREIQSVGSLDSAVFAVATGGLWQQGENYGNIRVVVRNIGWEHTRSQFYVQWLWSDESTKTVKEFSTTPIQELNEGNWINLNKIEQSLPSENGARFKLFYQDRLKEGESITILQVGEPSKYELLQP